MINKIITVLMMSSIIYVASSVICDMLGMDIAGMMELLGLGITLVCGLGFCAMFFRDLMTWKHEDNREIHYTKGTNI